VWAWMPLLSAGLLAWVPPLHAWLKSHDPVHLRLTIGLAAACWVPLILVGIDPATGADPAQPREPTVVGEVGVWLFVIAVAVAVVTAYRLRDTAFGLASARPGRRVDTDEPLSDKRQLVAGLLGIFLGFLGAGRLYVGDRRTATRQLMVTILTCGLGWVWGLADGINVLVNGGYDAHGRRLWGWRT
jgi:TM2 domain